MLFELKLSSFLREKRDTNFFFSNRKHFLKRKRKKHLKTATNKSKIK